MPADYVTLDSLRALLPAQHILEALDDDNDGAEDDGVWDTIAAAAQEGVDGLLSGRFAVPFSAPVPALVLQAAKIFAAEIIYQRRGVEADKNPWTSQAKALRLRLTELGDSNAPAPTDFPGVAKAAAVIIGETARTFSGSGRMSL